MQEVARTRSGLQGRALAGIVAPMILHAAAFDDPSTIVVPFAVHVEDALRLRVDASVQQQVLTMGMLVQGLAERLLAPAWEATPELTRAVVSSVLRVDEQVIPIVRNLGLEAGSPHVAAAVDRALTVLALGDVATGSLEHVAADSGCAPRDRIRAQLLAAVRKGLDARLHALSSQATLGVRDSRHVLELLSHELDAASPDAVERVVSWLGTRVRVQDVLDLPPVRMRLLESLGRCLAVAGGQLTLSLPLARSQLVEAVATGAPDDSLAQRIERRLQQREARMELAPRAIGQVASLQRGPLHALAQLCFTEADAVHAPAEGALSLLIAHSPEDEAEAICREVVRAFAQWPDLAPEQVCVALGQLEPRFTRVLADALDEAAVPFFLERGQPPTSAPSVAWFLQLADALAHGTCTRKTLLDAVAGGMGVALSARDAGDEVPRRVAQAALDGLLQNLRELDLADVAPDTDRDQLLSGLREFAQQRKQTTSSRGPEYDQARDKLEQRLFAIRDALVSASRANVRAEALACLAHMYGALRLEEATRRGLSEIVREPDAQRRRMLLRRAGIDAQAVRELRETLLALEQATRLAGLHDEPCGLDVVLTELREALAGRAQKGAGPAGAVSIEHIDRRVGRSCDVLIVGACHDGLLPGRPNDDPLVTPSLRQALARLDPWRAPSEPRLAAAGSLLAALDAVASTRRRVVLVMRLRDFDGANTATGPLVAELARRAGLIGPGQDVREQPNLRLCSSPVRPAGQQRLPRDARIASARRCAESGQARVPDARAKAAAVRAWIEEQRRVAFGMRLGQAEPESSDDQPAEMPWRVASPQQAFSELDGVLAAGTSHASVLIRMQSAMVGTRPLSATVVESFAGCHFRGWVSHVLGAKSATETPEDLDPRSRGRLAHELLEKTYKSLPAEVWDPRRDWLTRFDQARRHLHAVAGSLTQQDAVRSLRALELEQLVLDLEDLLASDLSDAGRGKPFRARAPLAFELAFGTDDVPPLVLQQSEPSVAVRGRIDRLDEVQAADGSRALVVIDYKGSARPMSSPPLLVTDLQLPLYALAARNLSLNGASSERVDAAVMTYRRKVGMSKPASSCGARASAAGPFGGWDDALGNGGDWRQSPFVRAIVRLINERMRGGIVTANGTEEVCRICELRPACRKPALQTAGEDSESAEAGS